MRCVHHSRSKTCCATPPAPKTTCSKSMPCLRNPESEVRVSVELTSLTASEARRRLDLREFSAVELAQAHLERIDQLEPRVHAFITVMHEVAMEQARQADQRIARGDAA